MRMPPLLRDSSSSSSMPQARLHYVDSASCAGNNSHCKGRVKCVFVGDGAVGKTSLIVSYTTNGYPIEYVPTAFDNYNVVVNVDNQPIMLQLCDTAGQDDFDSLRPLCYPGTDVYVVCFSVVSPTSFGNVTSRWLPEIRHHSPSAQIILVGTQSDLRSDVKVLIELARYREKPVLEMEAQRLAERIGAIKYIECSALTQKNLKEVFDQAILVALRSSDELRRLTAGRSKGSKLLASLHNWRGSLASDRGGLLRSSRRSKSSKDGAESSSSSSSNIQQHAVKESFNEGRRRPRFWQRLCCMT